MFNINKFAIFLFLFITMLISSCVPPQANSRNTTKSSTDKSSEESEDTTTTISTISWYSSGQLITGTLAQNANSTSSFYIRGDALSSYIKKNYKETSTFCVVSSFNNLTEPSAKKQLRFKAIPFRVLNSSEYALRIEIVSSADNLSFCKGDTVAAYDANDSVVSYINQADAAFTYDELCPTCTQIFLSDSIKIYESINGSIASALPISRTVLNLLSLRLKVDVTNNIVSDTNSCSLTQCQNSGFDCCLDGQCVKDGTVKPNPDSTSLALALYDVSLNYNNFKKWPTVYFVCQENTTPPDDSTGDDTDPIDEANTQLLALIKDYECLQGDATKCDPDLLSVQKKTWKMCGCLLDPITEDPLDPRCPDYTLKTITNNSGVITKVECSIPVEEVPSPFQNLNINVSAKSAPHRFFNSAGKNYDSLSKVPVGEEQEGEEFLYLDELNKVSPVSSSFNMNAILGNMSIALDKALPATVINLELDQSYIIEAKTGFYSPCATCQYDPWYSVFSSHPEVNSPFGLSFRNYTTKRYAYENNSTNGNYEDTIFGRACWLPPTMIPFSHKSETSLTTQRRNRLETQAAFFVNGYQRDWFGFNKGALIGSFDGVNWFAIGNGRRVQSTSTKLFLAINAPFADVAESTNYNVNVIQDLGGQTASNFDWDFDVDFNASGQNPAASCQYMHSCEADSDCISKLGWEYACADVSDQKTSWPKFDINANEKANNTLANTALGNILISGLSGDSQKRCVYRGAGSLCKVNNATGLTANQQKLLTCAPNFYCATLASASFNKEVKRSTNEPTNITFGQGANVLGRPKKYVGASGSLTAQIRTNILDSISSYPGTVSASEYGLCVPGKSVTGSNVNTQHRTKDSGGRTDYISQISGCNASTTNGARVYSCPTIDSSGNIIRTGSPTLLTTHNQNMCGAESKSSSGVSTFKNIEKGVLNSLTSLNTASFAADACFRRAGSTCHSDLDCAPSFMHANETQTLGISNFGGTQAEFDFWSEDLVCGQAQTAPIYGASSYDEYKAYDMSQNKCCREISKDFTMYTSISGSDRAKIAGYIATNDTLDTNQYPYKDPTVSGRYSRYANSAVADTYRVEVSSDSAPVGSQWKTINETGTKNCCGGGFVRKFEDGTTNWNVRNRLRLSPENFACLNYKSSLYKKAATTDVYVKGNWTADYSQLCLYPRVDDNGNLAGCIQEDLEYETVPYVGIDSVALFRPVPYSNKVTARFSSEPKGDFDGSGSIDLGNMVTDSVIYPPTVFKNTAKQFTNELLIFRNPAQYDNLQPQDRVVTFFFPSYITNVASINTATIRAQLRGEDFTAESRPLTQIADDCGYTELIAVSNSWCVGTSGSRSYISFYALGDSTPANAWQWGWIDFEFTENYPAGAMTPASTQYYEQRLSKFELLGVPQVSHNYIACNDSDSAANLTLIPGIFSQTTVPAAQLNASRIHYKTDSSTIKHSQIFASNDFRCCSKVGNKVDVPTKCCTGYGERTGSETAYTCKLPSGSDLHLYLNKFISSEGSYELEDASGDEEKLLETDFDSETGYPAYTTKVYTLIKSFGEEHCSSKKVREGGAVGNFGAQPGIVGDTSRRSIVDSSQDYDQDTGAGYGAYMAGYRWNIHSYCE